MTEITLTREEAIKMARELYPHVDFSKFTEEEFGLMEEEIGDFVNMSPEEYREYQWSLFDHDC